MGCNHAWFRRKRAGGPAGPAYRFKNPTPAPSPGARSASSAASNRETRLDSRRGKGPPDPASDEHPSDPDPWLRAKLDELHAAVQDAHDLHDLRGLHDAHDLHDLHDLHGESAASEVEAHGTDDTTTRSVLATLARVWIDWLIEAAESGDAAARAHLRDLGFGGFGMEADAGGCC